MKNIRLLLTVVILMVPLFGVSKAHAAGNAEWLWAYYQYSDCMDSYRTWINSGGCINEWDQLMSYSHSGY
jgi:hypothetical protein